jgi:phosphomannomutase
MKSRKIFIFDVDGTLTPSRQPMTKEFQKYFSEWSKKNKFYLVTGSDLPKLQEQMCMYDIEAEGIFTCCGNEMWIPDPHIVNISAYQEYRKEFKPPNTLLTYLGDRVRMSNYPWRYGNHIEDRGTLLNFSIVGRDCTQEQREEYSKWDTLNQERKEIVRDINYRWPELDAVLGGQISIDIYPKGNDKSQIFKHVEEIENIYCPDGYIFIGDRTDEGGNDYPLAKLMEETHNCKFHQVGDYRKTWWYLQRYELGLEKLND